MNTRSSYNELFPPLPNPERLIQHPNRANPPNLEEMSNNNNGAQPNGAPDGGVPQPFNDLRPMEERLQSPFQGVRMLGIHFFLMKVQSP